MSKDYQKSVPRAATGEIMMPDSVSVAMGELAGAMKEGLLAFAVGAGLQVMQVLIDESVTGLCGPKGRHDADRVAVRHGHESGSVALGGRKVPVRRPRVRSADRTAEVAVPAYEAFASTDLLGELALERMMAKLSTRRYGAGLEPVGQAVQTVASGTSRSAVSRRFVAMTERAFDDLMATDLTGSDLVTLMIDGVHFAEHLCVVALGITVDGTKVPLGLVEGSTENTTVVTDRVAHRPAPTRSRRHPPGVGRDRRSQSARRCGERGVRPAGDPALPDPQGPQRWSSSQQGPPRCGRVVA